MFCLFCFLSWNKEAAQSFVIFLERLGWMHVFVCWFVICFVCVIFVFVCFLSWKRKASPNFVIFVERFAASFASRSYT